MPTVSAISRFVTASVVIAGVFGCAPPAAADAPLDERLAAACAALREAPLDADLLLERGVLYRIAGEWDRARRDLGLAARLDPVGAGLADLERAALELDAGRPPVALAAARRAGAAAPTSAAPLRFEARAHAALGDWSAAAAAMERAVARAGRLTPEDVLDLADWRERSGAPRAHVLQDVRRGIRRLGPAVALVRRANDLQLREDSVQAAGTTAPKTPAAPAPSAGSTSAPPASSPASDALRSVASSASGPRARLRRGPYLQVGTPRSIVVRWRTDTPTDSRVSFRASANDAWFHVHEPEPTTEHEVEIEGLEPSTTYVYSIGHSAADGPPRVLAGGTEGFAFTTAPPHGTEKKTRVWVLGDSGSANRNARAVRDAWTTFSGGAAPDVWLMLGDNAYERGKDREYQRAVFAMYPSQLATAVLWPTRGNHDRLHDGDFNDYYDLFTMPTRGEAGGLPSGNEAYYSFDYANVHFVCLDSEGSSRKPGGAMLTWLEADLAATKQPWIIAFWHHPPYSKGSHDSDDPGDSGRRLVDMREFALPVLEKAGVDLVLCGHSHAYERSFQLHGHYDVSWTLTEGMKIDGGDGRTSGDGAYVKRAREPGVVYTVAGSSGKTSGGSLDHPVMVTSLNVLGSLVIDIEGRRLDASFLDSGGNIRDTFTIVKDGNAVGANPQE